MRQYSESDRSSAAASFARSVHKLGGTRSFSSSVHFSPLMVWNPEKESLPRVCPGAREAESRATTETTPRGGGRKVRSARSSGPLFHSFLMQRKQTSPKIIVWRLARST